MNTITSGRINLSPVEFSHRDVDLSAVLERMNLDPYTTVPSAGWGGVHHRGDSADSEYVLRTSPGAPRLFESDAGQALVARRLVDRFSPGLERQFGGSDAGGVPERLTHRLEAVDVLLMSRDTTRLLVATHDAVKREPVVALVQSMLPDSSDGADRLPNSWLHADPDFFLWLIYRNFTSGTLADGLDLLELRFVRGQNPAGQRIDVRDSADEDRAELRAIIAQPNSGFTTAKFAVRHQGLRLAVDLQLSLDGTFTPFVTTSRYLGDVEQREDWALHLSVDVAMTVIPDLFVAHRQDEEWEAARTEFRAESRQRVADLLA